MILGIRRTDSLNYAKIHRNKEPIYEIKHRIYREKPFRIRQNVKNEIVKALNKGIEEGNLATLKELREGTDGNKINLSGSVRTEMETTEDRIKAFESIVGK